MRHRVMVAVLLGTLIGSGVVQESAGEYRDASYGFKISPPAFPVETAPKSRVVATFFGAAENGFVANMNVQVQSPGMGVDDFVNLSRAQFVTAGFEVLEEKKFMIGQRSAVQWVYTGKLQERDLKFMAWAVERGEQIFLITCTGLADSFDKYEATFQAALESFAFTN